MLGINTDEMHGWLGRQAAELMYETALEAPVPRFLELGTFAGKSACVLAKALKDRGDHGTLICCDYFPMQQWAKKTMEDPAPEKVANTLLQTWENLRRYKLEDYVLTIKGNYGTLLPTLNGCYGVVYVDGGHFLDRVLADCLYAWNHLVPGGYLMLHDYENDMFPDVKQVVDALLKLWDREIFAREGITVIIRK